MIICANNEEKYSDNLIDIDTITSQTADTARKWLGRMIVKLYQHATCSTLALAMACVSAAAQAQTAAPTEVQAGAPGQAADSQADEANTSAGLADIVVTARRRAENLQDVPLSVTAFTPDTLAQSRIQDRTDLANFTPSLISITGGYPKEFAFFALRGQGPAFGATPGVVSYFAEVAAPIAIDGRTGTYFDLANVQVLAGPQGTLFGKNATGGNILFEPQRPTNKHEGYVQLEYGNLRDVRTEFAVNLPIVDDKVLLRVAGEVRSPRRLYQGRRTVLRATRTMTISPIRASAPA